MQPNQRIAKGDTSNLLNTAFGTKKTLAYYLQLAEDAGSRMKVALAANNTHLAIFEAQAMLAATSEANAFIKTERAIMEDIKPDPKTGSKK